MVFALILSRVALAMLAGAAFGCSTWMYNRVTAMVAEAAAIGLRDDDHSDSLTSSEPDCRLNRNPRHPQQRVVNGWPASGSGEGGTVRATAAASQQPRQRRKGGGGLGGHCVVCWDRPATVGYLHEELVHCCLCGGCWEQLRMRGEAMKCPVCRQVAPCRRVVAT